MIDNFALVLSHGLLALAFWRLMYNEAVDSDEYLPAVDKDNVGDA